MVQASKTTKILYLDVNISRPWGWGERKVRGQKKRGWRNCKKKKENKRCKLHYWWYFGVLVRQVYTWSSQPKSGKPVVPTMPHNHMARFGSQEDEQWGSAGSLLWPTGEHLDGQPRHPSITMSVPVSSVTASESSQPLPNTSYILNTDIFPIHGSAM